MACRDELPHEINSIEMSKNMPNLTGDIWYLKFSIFSTFVVCGYLLEVAQSTETKSQ